jgi:hypothetical protein
MQKHLLVAILVGGGGVVGRVGVVVEAACVTTDRRVFDASYDTAHTTLLANYVSHAAQVCLVVDDLGDLHQAAAPRMCFEDPLARHTAIDFGVAGADLARAQGRRAKVAIALVVCPEGRFAFGTAARLIELVDIVLARRIEIADRLHRKNRFDGSVCNN